MATLATLVNLTLLNLDTVLCAHSLLEHTNVTMQLDNEALHDTCRHYLDAVRPTYTSRNRLIAQVISFLTVSLRFGGALNIYLTECQTPDFVLIIRFS